MLDHPYMVATVSKTQIGSTQSDETAVKQRYNDLYDALPARPKSYVLPFDVGDSHLTLESEKLIQAMLHDIKELPAPELVVIGHTDASGDDDFNDRLSLQRATTVLNYLKTKGIDTKRVSAVGRGSREPIVKTRKGAFEARNRRVEIRLK